MTIEGFDGRAVCLVSYDVAGTARSTAARVCQIVYGRRGPEGGGVAPRQEGYIRRPGVVWVGQSVLILPRKDAEELATKLRGLGARVACVPISIGRTSVEAFRRPRTR